MRLDDSKLYIRNAVGDPEHKKHKRERDCAIAGLSVLLSEHKPPLVLCFGQFAFECARRARQEDENSFRSFRYWSVERLAREFAETIPTIRMDSVKLLPVLHAVVAQKFPHCHRYFSGGRGNYFEYVGEEIAQVLINNSNDPRLSRLWMQRPELGDRKVT
jgi:hypothetical protein